MAPNTRRAAALKNGPASNGVSTPSSRAARSSTAQKASANPPKRRGRPPKVPQAAAIESVSSAATPTTAVSDSEYSTPATSNAVTPAPSVPAKAAPVTSTTRSTRSRLVIELPELPSDSDEGLPKPKKFSSRAKRPRRAHDSVIGDSEDDLDSESFDPSLALARRLQHEEDHQAALALAAEPSANASRRNGTKKGEPSFEIGASDSGDDIEIISENPVNGKGKAKGKSRGQGTGNGKGKSTAKATASKRSLVGNSSGDDDDEEPLLQAAYPRKKLKLDLSESDDEELALLAGDEEDSSFESTAEDDSVDNSGDDSEDSVSPPPRAAPRAAPQATTRPVQRPTPRQRSRQMYRGLNRAERERLRLEQHHPELKTMWRHLEEMPVLKAGKAEQPQSINRILKPFQLEGLAWMKAMEKIEWKGGLLGDEMGLGKTIQAVSLIMSDYPAKMPSLVLVPPVALMQWTTEIASYTDGKLKTLVFHGTNSKAKNMTVKQLKAFDVILMSYNSLESLYRKQEKGFRRKDGLFKEKSAIHQIKFHRVILDEAHCIKTRTTMTAKACFALKVDYRWCLTGTPLQNRIGEFFSLIRFLNIAPFASYFCKQCPCSTLEWNMNEDGKCTHCK